MLLEKKHSNSLLFPTQKQNIWLGNRSNTFKCLMACSATSSSFLFHSTVLITLDQTIPMTTGSGMLFFFISSLTYKIICKRIQIQLSKIVCMYVHYFIYQTQNLYKSMKRPFHASSNHHMCTTYIKELSELEGWISSSNLSLHIGKLARKGLRWKQDCPLAHTLQNPQA